MRRIAHLSDLHFGRLAPGALAPLRECVRRSSRTWWSSSGDLTASANARQFRDARAFLDTLPGPQVVVPGRRRVCTEGILFRAEPRSAAYRRFVSDDVEPEYADDVVAVIGVNTSDAARGTPTAAMKTRDACARASTASTPGS